MAAPPITPTAVPTATWLAAAFDWDIVAEIGIRAALVGLEAVLPNERPVEHLSPALIVEACPTIKDSGRAIRDFADVVAAGRYLRASLGAHESAWNEAVAEIGPVGAAAAVIYVLQLYEDDIATGGSQIRNPGGYFRALVRMVKAGKLNLAVELMAMRRKRAS